MITLNYENQSYKLKNSADEFLIKEFEHICSILNDTERHHVDKWSEILVYLGVPQDLVDNLDGFEFLEIIKNFNIDDTQYSPEIIKDIEIDGIKYQAYDETFKLTVREMTLIEAAVKKNKDRFLGDILAIIYKRTDVDKEITYDKAHIHHKAELIRKNITANVAMPILAFLGKKLIKDFNLITNAE